MRSVLDESLPDSCSVVAIGAPVPDGAGGETPGTPSSVTVACRVSPVTSPSEMLAADRVSARSEWMITLPAETVIAETATITSGSRSFEVVQVEAARSYEISRRVRCVEAGR